jgi:RimJ/RimL family protein N-acetyltransferase
MELTAPHPLLRPWSDADLPAFALMHAEPDVVEWLGGENLARINMRTAFKHVRDTLAERGWGIWAMLDDAGEIAGAAGLQPAREALAPRSALEFTWRLTDHVENRARLVKVMRRVLPWAFKALRVKEIVCFAAQPDLRAQALLSYLGFSHDLQRSFDHPDLHPDHPLRRQVVYTLRREAVIGAPEAMFSAAA